MPTWPARWSLIAANIWRGIPFVAISLLAGLQTISPSLYEAALLDGSTAWQRFRYITFPLLLPILAIVMTFSIIFTFTDFQLVYAITRGGPVNSTHLMATLAFQRGIAGGELGEGAAIAVSMIPFLVFATLFSYFALARRKWTEVANAIARFEPLSMVCNTGDAEIARSMFDPAVADNIETFETPTDDAWARDSGPTFLVHPDGRLGATHWRFNAWGNAGFSRFDDEQHVVRLGGVEARRQQLHVALLGAVNFCGEGDVPWFIGRSSQRRAWARC